MITVSITFSDNNGNEDTLERDINPGLAKEVVKLIFPECINEQIEVYTARYKNLQLKEAN
jgi:hypothetical protein